MLISSIRFDAGLQADKCNSWRWTCLKHAGINSSGRRRVNRTAWKINHFRAIAEIRAWCSVNSRPAGLIPESGTRISLSNRLAGRVRACRRSTTVSLCSEQRSVHTTDIYASLTDDWARRLPDGPENVESAGSVKAVQARTSRENARVGELWRSINLWNKSETFVRDLQLESITRDFDCGSKSRLWSSFNQFLLWAFNVLIL